MMMAIVYRHMRLDKNEVFYIGISKVETRPYSRYSRNSHWKNIVSKTEYRVDVLFDDLTWEEAQEKEKEFIKLYGRKDLGLGTLVNMTDGGDGIIGRCGNKHPFYGRTHTQETKIKIRNKKLGIPSGTKGKKHTEKQNKDHSNIMKGRKISEETKKKISLSLIGKNIGKKSNKKGTKLSDKTKLKMSNSQKIRYKKLNNI